MDSFQPAVSRHERSAGAALVFGALAILAVVSNRLGSYFDDEISAIRLMERARDWREIVMLANGADVHPPLGYLIDFVLHRLTGNWKAVQLVAGLANAAALAGFAWLAGGALPRRTWLILAFLLATAASQIMWGASLRWYAWFNPVFALALGALLWAPLGARGAAAALALAGVALFHIGYLALIAVPLLGIAWGWRFARTLERGQWPGIALMAALGLALCLPQLRVLAEVHLAGADAQRGGLLLTAAQTGLTAVLGNAVFPLGVLPALAVLSAGGAGWALVRARAQMQVRALAPLVMVLAMGGAALVLSGLGIKPRNSLCLNLAFLPVLAAGLAAMRPPWRVCGLAGTALFQVQGVANVALHEGTTKRSFNTPYPAVVATIERMAGDCPKAIVAHDDVVLGHVLAGRMAQSRPGEASAMRLYPGDCVIRETGTAFDRPDDLMAPWSGARARGGLRPEEEATFREEPATAWIARRLGRPVIAQAARLEKLRVTAPTVVPAAPGDLARPDP